MPIIEGLLEELAAAPPKPMREFHVVQLEHAMADDVVYTLQRVSDRGTREAPGPSFDFERDANRVIVRATPDQWKNIQEVIESLDRPVENPLVTEIVSLQWSEANRFAKLLASSTARMPTRPRHRPNARSPLWPTPVREVWLFLRLKGVGEHPFLDLQVGSRGKRRVLATAILYVGAR